MKLQVFDDADSAARAAAAMIAAAARAATAARGRFILAVSGGHTPWMMLRALTKEDVPWQSVHIVQVDERIAPDGDPDRNLTHLRESLGGQTSLPDDHIHAMPVEAPDLDAAAAQYATTLRNIAGGPPVLDLVHLGLGPDGHTASLVPKDPVLSIADTDVALTGVYQGRRRMTLTYPILNRSRHVLWLATGPDKTEMVSRLSSGDTSIPAGRVQSEHAVLLADRAAAGSVKPEPLSSEELRKMNAYWRAANYLSVGQIYLYANPLLREPLKIEHIKPRLLGHWGTTPGLNFIYVHLNRAIKKYDLNTIYICGPGHGGPGMVANTYLEGTYSELYSGIQQSEEGMRKLFKQFSFPGGIPSHAAPETPGSIHEGGELGYALVHAFGAVFDNPDLLACCVVGDGESETGPLATSWHSNKFLNPKTDGAVLPILHLNGYKIANPTVLGRLSDDALTNLFTGYGYKPYFVEGSDPELMHQLMAATLDIIIKEIQEIQNEARANGPTRLPVWPMMILRTPKGWTGPKIVDGKPVEGTWRAHQVPVADLATKPEHLTILEDWMKSYKPEELFNSNGQLIPELAELAPQGNRRMGANPHANGGLLLKDLVMPDFRKYGSPVSKPGTETAESTKILGVFLRDVMKMNEDTRNFRVFGPDETASNRLDALYQATDKRWMEPIVSTDEQLSPDGRVVEVLSEHMCQGWLEGYLLTGRHGLFSCYEAFIHIVDSMFNQHAKWLKTTRHIPWRRPVSSLNYLLTSHVWRQDHNGFSHQDPGFIDFVMNKKADVIRVYLPPDANTLLSVADHCLRSRHYVNVIVAGKQPELQWLNMDAAVAHCTNGIGIWSWASTDQGAVPDVVMACAGDVPTLETLAAVDLLRRHFPDIKIRVVNVVDLMTLQPSTEHPHGLSDGEFDSMFTSDRPIIFAYHGYPWLIHRLTYRRHGHDNLHVRGYKEEGTTTTPFDMTVLNTLDRYHLAGDAVDRVPRLQSIGAHFQQFLRNKLIEHKQYVREHGDDMPEVKNWVWPY